MGIQFWLAVFNCNEQLHVSDKHACSPWPLIRDLHPLIAPNSAHTTAGSHGLGAKDQRLIGTSPLAMASCTGFLDSAWVPTNFRLRWAAI